MAGATIPLTYTADVSQLLKSLQSIPTMTAAEARKAVKQVNAALKEVAAAQAQVKGPAAAASKSVAGLGSQLRLIGVQMPDIVTQMSAGTSAFQVLAQQGLQVGQQMAATGTLTTALLGPIGAVIAAVGALGIAYAALTGPLEREQEAQKALAEINRSTEATHRRLESAYIDQAVALGALTKAQGDQMRASDAARQAVIDFGAAQRGQREELQATIASSERWLNVTRGVYAILPDGIEQEAQQINVLRRLGDQVFGWSDSMESARAQLGALDRALTTEAEQQKELRDVTVATAEATEGAAKADRGAAEAARERARALEALRGIISGAAEAELADVGRVIAERDRELDKVQELSAAAGDAALVQAASDAVRAEAAVKLQAMVSDTASKATADTRAQSEIVIAARDAELARLDEIDRATAGAAETEAARVEVIRRADRELVKSRSKAIETIAAREERAHEEELRRIEQRRAAYLQAGDTIASSLGTVAEALQNADGATDEQRLAAFEAAKAIAVAQAIVNTAQGITAALTLPPPLGEIAAATVAAAGAAQVAVISSTEPSFHRGGIDYGLLPDENRTRRTTSTEGILTARGVRAIGGPAALEEANRGAGKTPGAAPGVVAVLTPPGAPSRLLREALRSRGGAAMVRDAARPSVLRVRR